MILDLQKKSTHERQELFLAVAHFIYISSTVQELVLLCDPFCKKIFGLLQDDVVQFNET